MMGPLCATGPAAGAPAAVHQGLFSELGRRAAEMIRQAPPAPEGATLHTTNMIDHNAMSKFLVMHSFRAFSLSDNTIFCNDCPCTLLLR